jgi:hypothetical protein
MKGMSFGVVVALALLAGCASEAPEVVPLETYQASIRYSSVPEAQAALTAKANGKTSVDEDGWLHVRESITNTTFVDWRFAPSGDPAYPTAIFLRQDIVPGHYFHWQVRCEAAIENCDQLVHKRKKDIEELFDET